VTMSIQFLGAAGEVTGSCHLVTVGKQRVLLDCGLIQGGHVNEARNREPFPFNPGSIDAVVLSHAHADQLALKNWYANFKGRPPVTLVHGEERAITGLSDCLRHELSAPVHTAQPGELLELA
jgi:Cft2 family RNA processing exonuclease